MRGFEKSGVIEQIREAGGELFAITSEPQSLASEAQAAWELGFESIGDPHHEILAECRRSEQFDLYIGDTDALVRSWASHPNGHFQPGVLALTSDRRVLYRWRSRPTHQNQGGAGSRATPSHVWAQVQSGLAATTDAEWDADPELDAPNAPWPLFLAFLFAHGWFIKPKRFPLGRPGEQSTRIREMKPRLVGFVVAWVIGFVMLPARWVLLALAGYAAAITPAIRRMNRDFQHVPEDEALPS